MIARKDRSLATLFLLYMTALILMVLLHGCGPNAREKTLSASLTSVNAARDGFVVFNKQHQDDIADAAKTDPAGIAAGDAQLDAYLAARAPVKEAFELAYAALATAAIDSNTPLVDATRAVVDLLQKLAALKAQSASSSSPRGPSKP